MSIYVMVYQHLIGTDRDLIIIILYYLSYRTNVNKQPQCILTSYMWKVNVICMNFERLYFTSFQLKV